MMIYIVKKYLEVVTAIIYKLNWYEYVHTQFIRPIYLNFQIYYWTKKGKYISIIDWFCFVWYGLFIYGISNI